MSEVPLFGACTSPDILNTSRELSLTTFSPSHTLTHTLTHTYTALTLSLFLSLTHTHSSDSRSPSLSQVWLVVKGTIICAVILAVVHITNSNCYTMKQYDPCEVGSTLLSTAQGQV
jgi:hypothetical protein